jgi:hypothetical protein
MLHLPIHGFSDESNNHPQYQMAAPVRSEHEKSAHLV